MGLRVSRSPGPGLEPKTGLGKERFKSLRLQFPHDAVPTKQKLGFTTLQLDPSSFIVQLQGIAAVGEA